MSNELEFRIERPVSKAVIDILKAHHQEMFEHSPPQNVHALDESQFHVPNITFFSAWLNEQLAGCGALKALDPTHVEIKSMRTSSAFLRQGIAAKLLAYLLESAKQQGFTQVSLETGTMAFFEPARSLYRRFGFVECPPFDNYFEDPNSVCMTRALIDD